MKKILLTLSIALGATLSQAQNVGIGTSSPNSSAKLDISASDKGILFPNVALTGTSDASTITSPATGLIVWNTGSGGLSPAGFYYNAGTSGSPDWTKVANGAVLTNTLTDGRILIGNGSNIATEQTVSGDATISNTGVLDLNNNAVETSEINDNAVTGAKIDISGNSNGSLMYYNGTDWVNLAPGTSGQVLRTNGVAAPTWSDPTGIVTVENGLTETAPATIRLGGALTQPTTVSALTATNKMSFTGTGVDAFNVDGTTFSVDATNDRVGIGTAASSAKLSISGTGTALSGAAVSTNFNTLAGALGGTAGNTLKLASIGFTSSNQTSLGIEARRTSNGTDWTTSALGLKFDVDATSPVNAAEIWMTAGGNVGIGTVSPIEKLDINGNARIPQANYLKFYHSNESDANDGKIGTALFSTGLNIVGTRTDGTFRKVSIWGEITQHQNDGTNIWSGANRFISLAGTGNRTVYVDANGTLTTNPGNHVNMYRFVNNTVVNIPDNNTQTNSNITVSGVVGNIVHMEVIVSINHTFDGDLDIFLNGPNGNTIELSTDNGGFGDNYFSTKFTDDAPNCITAGSAAFDFGTYRPENGGTCQRGFRTNYYGSNPNGTWQLRVWDDAGGDTGSIQGWEIRIWTQ